MSHALVAYATDTPGDRLAFLGSNAAKILFGVLVLALACVLAVFAAAACIVVGPALLIIALVGWIYAASWAGEVAAVGGMATAVGVLFIAMGSS